MWPQPCERLRAFRGDWAAYRNTGRAAGVEDLLFRPGPPGVPELFRVLTPPGTTWGPARGAGHTHGGQIALPFTPDWSWLTFAKKDEVNADGWAEEEYGAPGNRLYVNRGIGFRLMRIGAAPELTLFTLTAGTAR